MITGIEIARLRGVERGVLADISPLTVLVGTNGCGKSTVLDALLVGASHAPGDAIGRAVQRREGLSGRVEWLFFRAGRDAKVIVTESDGRQRSTSLVRTETVGASLSARLVNAGGLQPFGEIDSEFNVGSHALWSRTAISANDTVVFDQGHRRPAFVAPIALTDAIDEERRALAAVEKLPRLHFLERRPGARHSSFQKLYTQVVQAGVSEAALALARAVVPGLLRMEILTPDDAPAVYLVFSDHALPLAAAGDGVKSVIRLALALASRSADLVLLEEPEAHQHPGALVQSARVLLEAVRRGAQIVLSTHSLELIDALVAHSAPSDLEKFCVQRLELGAGGDLVSVRTRGEDVAFERGDIDQDLR